MAEPVVVPPWDEHNQALVDNVHPASWTNPTPAARYNLVVIGAGTAGLVTAIGAAGLGARVALVERELMGGDCLNVGCVPSKALLGSARVWAAVRDAARFGVLVPAGARVDFPAVMARMRSLRARISKADAARRYRDLGVDVFFGAGRFTGPDTVEVDGAALRFKKAVVTTGGRAAALPIPGLAEAGYLTNESVFTLTALPPRLGVIGGGPIGCELAQAFARFGAHVTVLEAAPEILIREDPDAAALVAASLRRDGVELVTGAKVERVERARDERAIHFERAGQRARVAVDEVLVAVGRTPNVDGLGLDVVGVAHDPRTGVAVDDHLRTSNRRIYAAGDVCSRLQFTHNSDF